MDEQDTENTAHAAEPSTGEDAIRSAASTRSSLEGTAAAPVAESAVVIEDSYSRETVVPNDAPPREEAAVERSPPPTVEHAAPRDEPDPKEPEIADATSPPPAKPKRTSAKRSASAPKRQSCTTRSTASSAAKSSPPRGAEEPSSLTSSASPARKVPPERLYRASQEALAARERTLDAARQRLREAEEARLAGECTFHPRTGHSGGSNTAARDTQHYFQASQEWLERRARNLEKLRQQAEREALDEEHRIGVTPGSVALVARMAEEKRYCSLVTGWHERIAEHVKRQQEAEEKARPPFKPAVHDLPAFYRTRAADAEASAMAKPRARSVSPQKQSAKKPHHSTSPVVRRTSLEEREKLKQSAGAGADRLYRLAVQELTEKEKRLEAERRRLPDGVKPPPRRDEAAIKAHVEAMLAKQKEAERKLRSKIERLKKEEELFDATFQPTITKASEKLAAKHRAKQQQQQQQCSPESAGSMSPQRPKGSGGAEANGAREVSSAPATAKRSAPLPPEFHVRNQLLLEERRRKAAQAEQARREAEERECSFAPRLSSHSVAIVHEQERHGAARRYDDPTAAHEQRVHGPAFRSVCEEFRNFGARLNDHKHADHSGFVFNAPRGSSPPSRAASFRQGSAAPATRSEDGSLAGFIAASSSSAQASASAPNPNGVGGRRGTQRPSTAAPTSTSPPPAATELDRKLVAIEAHIDQWKALLSDAVPLSDHDDE